MQGHRNHMEDRTVARTHFSAKLKQFSLYIVFDGHGGDESANHAQTELADFLLKQGKSLFEGMEKFKSYDVELAGVENRKSTNKQKIRNLKIRIPINYSL